MAPRPHIAPATPLSGWSLASSPPETDERVEVTHHDDAFRTVTTGRFHNGRWETAVAFMVAGGRALSFVPTHWRPISQAEAA